MWVCECAPCVLIVLPALPQSRAEGDLEEVTSSSSSSTTWPQLLPWTSLADEVNCPPAKGPSENRSPLIRLGPTSAASAFICLEITSLTPGKPPTCPLCKEPFRGPGNFRPNWQLATWVWRTSSAQAGVPDGLRSRGRLPRSTGRRSTFRDARDAAVRGVPGGLGAPRPHRALPEDAAGPTARRGN